jgi:transposase
MPWKECSVMDERLQFVAPRLAGEAMSELCREFGISRKTGYKVFDRYQETGIQGITDRSRRPYRYTNQVPFQVENFILNVKGEHPSWGARKIRERLLRRFSGIPIPAQSTIHAVLDRHGLVERRGRRRRRAQATALSWGSGPTNSGAPTTKASSCWAIGSTAIRSPSPTTPAAFCSPAKRSLPPENSTLSPCLSSFSRSEACLRTSAATTASPSLPHMPYSTLASWRCGGCAWASASNASSPAIPSRTAATNACISP